MKKLINQIDSVVTEQMEGLIATGHTCRQITRPDMCGANKPIMQWR